MATQLGVRSDFTGTLAIHVALKSALRGKQYRKNAAVRTAAQKLCNELQSEKSTFGRQLRMIHLMEKGATLAEMGRKLRCSRRTVFRYLNHLEQAGISIKLSGAKYSVGKGVVQLVKQ